MPKQYIIQYPDGHSTDNQGNKILNADLANMLLQALVSGGSVGIPDAWTVQVIDLNHWNTGSNTAPELEPRELSEEEFKDKFPQTEQQKE